MANGKIATLSLSLSQGGRHGGGGVLWVPKHPLKNFDLGSRAAGSRETVKRGPLITSDMCNSAHRAQ